MNWVEEGAVNSVRAQGFCGACWAFAGISTIESAHYIKTRPNFDNNVGELLSLSVQQPVDCDTRSKACSGGLIDNAAWYVLENGGL